MNTTYDVIIIGGGHAGIEAALAAARLHCAVLMITLHADNIGLMPCNPSIGGPAKGQMVGEIDALGGEMGLAADKTHIQLKILNRSRGPAVQCLRSQNDKEDYKNHMTQKIKQHPNITVLEAEADTLLLENKTVIGIATSGGQNIYAKAIVITTGTFLKGRMHTGLEKSKGGRINEDSAESLSSSLKKFFRLGRLKTGTPPRLNSKTIDYSKLSIQPGDPEFLRFSFRTPYNQRYKNQINCHLTRTTVATHKIILNNLDRSPLYTKVIKGSGPRYCPSIEDKVMRFSDKDSHHIFIEPETKNSTSIYPQGLNTSLPKDVQFQLLRSMPGLENVEVLKYGYAVEYDFVYPDQLKPTLETREVEGLFLAGQINGTSGYEEAAGQGLVAGINAGLKAKQAPPLILTREHSFIGTMIDDLITKNIYEPYRMLTSRSEHRLLLRQDNAIFRLSKDGYNLGLLTKEEFQMVQDEQLKINHHLSNWKKEKTTDQHVALFKLKQKSPLIDILKRPEVTINHLLELHHIKKKEKESAERALVLIKYEGYIQKQQQDIQKIEKIENKPLPSPINYQEILGLKKESVEKFEKFRPKTVYEAKRIAGINPADIMVLISYIERKKHHVSRETSR